MIDVDDNALAFKMRASNKTLSKTLQLMLHHLKQLAFSGGFIVTVVFYGSYRPDYKRASLDRRKKRLLKMPIKYFVDSKLLN